MAKQKPTAQGMGSNINFNNAKVEGTGDEEKKEEPVTNSQRGVDQEKNDLTKLSSLKLRDRTSVLSNEINTLRSEIKELKEREKELKEDCESLRKQQDEALKQVDGEKTNNVTNINNMKKLIEEGYDERIREKEKERNGILAEIKAKESEINKKEEERKNIWAEVERRDVANKAKGKLKIDDPDFLREMVENQIKEFNRIVKENDGKKLNDSDEEREQAVNSHEQGEKEASETGGDGRLGASDDTNSETETNKELSLEEWQKEWENDQRLFREKEKIINTIDKNKEPEKYRANQEVADLFYHIVRCNGIMKANEIGSENFNKAIAEREGYYNRVREITASLDELHSEQIRQETDRPKESDAEEVAVRGNQIGENATGDEELERNTNSDGQPSETGEGSEQTVADKRPAEEVVEPPVHEEGEPHVSTESPALGGKNSASEVFRERVEREGLKREDETSEGLKPKDETSEGLKREDETSVDEAAAVGSDSGAYERTPEADRAEVADAEEGEVGGSETEEKVTGDEEKAETKKPTKKTEAERLYDKDCALLEEKEGVLKKWQDVQKTWQARYDAATRKVRDRSKRARYSYEILRAEAQITTADIEVKRLKEIVGVSAKMVDAEKQFGKDSEQYIKAKNERERLYKLYQGYIDEVGEVQEVDRNKKGIIKDGDQRGQDRLNLKPAKPSKLKAFWNKIKKSFVAFVVGSVIGAGITGLALGINNSGKEKVDNPNTNTPIEQPADDSKDNELVDEIDKNFDTGSLTDEDKQQIEDKLEEVGSITSMVKVEGVEGVSYRKDADVDKVNIYITTQAGSIIEYQTQVTKDEVSELATTEGVTAKDVVDLILSDVSKNTPSASYKKIDEAKYGQLINNIRSDAEDIEFPDPGKDGNYTSFYVKSNIKTNGNTYTVNFDFLAIGPDSVVKVDDRVEYQTATGKNLNLRDPSALLNMIEKSLGGNASASGYSGEIETKFNSTSYFQSHKDENSQVEEAEAIQNIMDEAVAKTEKELFNDELTR